MPQQFFPLRPEVRPMRYATWRKEASLTSLNSTFSSLPKALEQRRE